MQGGGSALITDDMIRQAAEEYEQAVLDSLPDAAQWNHEFTPWFERKMKKLCQRQKHSGAYRVLRRIACAVAVVILCFCMLLAFNSQVRAAVIEWAKEQYETFTHYFFTDEAENIEPKSYDLAWVPEGFTLLQQEHTEDGGVVIYLNDGGQIIYLNYLLDTGSNTLFVEDGNYIYKTVTVGNQLADLYIDEKSGDANAIVWLDENNKVMFTLSAPFEEAVLVKIAENITALK